MFYDVKVYFIKCVHGPYLKDPQILQWYVAIDTTGSYRIINDDISIVIASNLSLADIICVCV